MNQFETIKVKGFRRLHDVTLPLAPLNVLIGANGAGKTSLLEVFSVLAASASGNLLSVMNDFGGIEANLSLISDEKAARSRECSLKIARAVPEIADVPLQYEITLRPRGVTYEITEESLAFYRDPNQRKSENYVESKLGQVRYFDTGVMEMTTPDWELNSMESALSQVPRMYEEPENFRRGLASSTHYHALDVSPRAPVKLPQPMRDSKLPGRHGEDLVSCLYWLRETNPDHYETIEDTLRAGFPNFERLNFPPVAAGTLALTWKERHLKHPFYMHQLSEGTLRFLWLVTLLYSPGLTEVTLLDEPEVSLHPELLSLLAECLRDASKRTQLIVATHADRLVRFLKPDEVIAVDLDESQGAVFTRATELDLGEWLRDYSMDQLWQNGRLGGRS